MRIEGARLSDSAFLADLDARDRSPWRCLATLIGGLSAGLAVGLIAGVLTLLALVLAQTSPAWNLAALPAQIGALVSGGGSKLTGSLTAASVAVATNIPLAVVFIAIAAAIGRRRMLAYLTAARSFRWRLLASGLLFSVVLIGPVVAVGQLIDPHAPPLPMLSIAPDALGRIGYCLGSIALLIPAAAAEEAVFRGWLLRQSAAFIRNPVVLMVLNGALFSAVHLEFAPDAFLTRTLMGAGFVYMTLRLGGIEFSTGAHAANNILIVLLIQPLSLTPTASGGFTIDSLVQDVFLVASYVIMAEVTARWGPLRRWSQADEAAARPAVGAPGGPWS